MPKMQDLKIQPDFFEDVMAMRKRSDVRRTDDRHFSVNNELRLWEFDGKKYTGRTVLVTVVHIKPLSEVSKLYKDKPTKIPMAVLSFSRPLIVTPGTLPPPPGV